MKSVLFALILAAPAQGAVGPSKNFSFDSLDNMQPIHCRAMTRQAEKTSVSNSAGKITVCTGKVECLYVKKDVLQTEFKGSEKLALLAAGELTNPDRVRPKTTTADPRFLTAIEVARCEASAGGQCPTAITCLINQKVKLEGMGDWKVPVGDAPADTPAGNAPSKNSKSAD